MAKQKKSSEGLIWVVFNQDGDLIQAWDDQENIVRKHCKKYGWTYTGLPAFRGTPDLKPKRMQP